MSQVWDRTLMREAVSRLTPDSDPRAILYSLGLNHRQVGVVLGVLKLQTNLEIADELRVEPETVTYHLRNIYRKLKITGPGSRLALLRLIAERSRLPHRIST